jgi:hypothetical protein
VNPSKKNKHVSVDSFGDRVGGSVASTVGAVVVVLVVALVVTTGDGGGGGDRSGLLTPAMAGDLWEIGGGVLCPTSRLISKFVRSSITGAYKSSSAICVQG